MGKVTDSSGSPSQIANSGIKAPTSEQLRMAQLLVDPNCEDHSVTRDKINKVMELTRCNENTALVALHDCDNDVEKAVDKLLEGGNQDEWFLQEGKKSKKAQQLVQQPRPQHRQQHAPADNYHIAEDHDYTNADDNAASSFGLHKSRGGVSRKPLNGSVDFPPRFRDRGAGGVRGARKYEKENEPFSSGPDGDRGRGAWRGRGRGHGDRGRGVSYRGGRRGGGGFGRSEGGFDQEIGKWNSSELESNTWDNSMANSCGSKPACKTEVWKTTEESNTWDNSQAAGSIKAKKSHHSNEWTTNTAEDWGGEEDWSKLRDGLIIEPSGAHQQRAGPAPTPVTAPSHSGATSYASVSNSSGAVRGESRVSESQPVNSSQAIWTAKQATADLKNELGIGKASPSPIGQMPQRDSLPTRQSAAKVELPSIGASATGPIDVQFGDTASLSDSHSLLHFDAANVFKPHTSVATAPQRDGLMPGRMDSSASVYQRTQKNERVNGQDLIPERKAQDMAPSVYALGGGYAAVQALGSAVPSSPAPTITNNPTSSVSNLGGSHQRPLLSNSVPVGAASANANHSSITLICTTASFLPIAQTVPAAAPRPTMASSVGGGSSAAGPYQQTITATNWSPYLNMYDQMSLNSVGFVPAQNLFLNAGGFDMRALTQLPPVGVNSAAGRDNDTKGPYLRQDVAGSGAAGLANLSVPPPGLPAPTVSNAEQAAQILSMAGMYPTMPFINPAAPPFLTSLTPQFLVPNVSSSAAGSQFQKAGGYPTSQPFAGAGYEDMLLSSQQDYGKNNYSALSSGCQTKTVSSIASNLTLGINEQNKGFTSAVKAVFDAKPFLQTGPTLPSFNNVTYPAPYQTTAATCPSYGYPTYMPPVNMNMLASPMAAVPSNIQYSSDAMNQHGGGHSSKGPGGAKQVGQYPFPNWGN